MEPQPGVLDILAQFCHRLLHWGPLTALCIIKFIFLTSLYVTSMWLSPYGSTLGTVNHGIFIGWDQPDDEQFLQYCANCDGFKTPRSHHCRKCERCVLKMDHHCPWINTCCGHRNHANFTLFLFFAVCGSIHASVLLIMGLTKAYHRTDQLFVSIEDCHCDGILTYIFCRVYKLYFFVPEAPCPIQHTPHHQQPLDIHLGLQNLRKRQTLASELHQSAAEKLHDRLWGHLLVFPDGSVWDSPYSAAASCVIPSTGTTIWCHLPFQANSTAAGLSGLPWQPTTSLLRHPSCPRRS
ncbi:hypothetical protein HPB51_005039 [Rhipicephalus microplus]|uniref:Palmitoyltransferase n=1 Tax=Rhipicephalus microplus TaxID=6941 RepID=A0A9J6EF51_RHIMP|nr:hypothetical protein HPB51_005039 [Rhipicephalus microplus]